MKKGPIILLVVLGLSLSFILGVQYGKRVEVTDKAIEALLQRLPTPTPVLSPQVSPVIYKTLTSRRCGFSFVYPSQYEIQITSTYSAQLLDSDRQVIAFSCSPTLEKSTYDNPNNASEPASLDSAPATEYVSTGDNLVTLFTTHPVRSIPFELKLSPEVRLLIEKTFKFQE